MCRKWSGRWYRQRKPRPASGDSGFDSPQLVALTEVLEEVADDRSAAGGEENAVDAVFAGLG